MTCRVFVSEHGNVFMREIAEHLVEALVIGGRPTELVTTELPAADGATNLVVAPHEFFGLFPATESVRLDAARHATCVNTEQPGTSFFALALRYIRRGGAALDINRFSLDALRRGGVTAVHLPLGYVPSMDRWHRARTERAHERRVDIAFMAGRTPRREAFIGGAAGMLWEWRTDLRFFSWHRPVTATKPSFAAGDAKYDSLAQTRILLNVHRGDDPYFEWARVVEAIANGCAIATETSVGIEPFAARHVLMAPLESLAEEAIALAFDEPRRAAMADAAYDVLIRDLDQATLLERALGAVDAARRADPRPDRPTHHDRPRRGLPSPGWFRRRTAPPAPTAEQHVLRHTAKGLKAAYLAEVASARGIERALSIARHGTADHVTVTTTPAWNEVAGDAPPSVSVVIPLYDQGRYLREAVDSVVSCSGPGSPSIELVVVDDHSTDDSLATARSILGQLPWLPMMLIGRAANGGLPVARNTGFAAARARYVLALDADNVLYPNCLRALAAHLDDAAPDVVAAYGLLERFDERGALGLTSHLPWDVELLVQGAYIDAMALLRRDAWSDLGGYSTAPGVYGWEDYDLWLAAAERGWRADLVPQIVGRYREQPGSMRKISDVDIAGNFVTLRERHPRLPWPS